MLSCLILLAKNLVEARQVEHSILKNAKAVLMLDIVMFFERWAH